MFYIRKLLIVVCLIGIGLPSLASYVYAASECRSIGVDYIYKPDPIPEDISQITLDFTKGLGDGRYRLRFASGFPGHHVYSSEADASEGKASFTVDNQGNKLNKGDHYSDLQFYDPNKKEWKDDPYCDRVYFKVGYDVSTCKMTATPPNPTDVEQIRLDVNYAPKQKYKVLLNNQVIGRITVGDDGTGNTVVGPLSPISNAQLAIQYDFEVNPAEKRYCVIPNFTITASGGVAPRPVPTVAPPPPPPPSHPQGTTSTPSSFTCPGDPRCTSAGGEACPGGQGIKTAIGCIHTDPEGFVKDFLSFAVGISGGLAFLMMLLGAFQMLTSAGNPETLQAGRERFSSAIIGLLIVVLAVLLLKIIGVDILGIPGFTQ